MLRYNLRTLLILLAIGPPFIAGVVQYRNWCDRQLWRSLEIAKIERDHLLQEWRRTYDLVDTGQASVAQEEALRQQYFSARQDVARPLPRFRLGTEAWRKVCSELLKQHTGKVAYVPFHDPRCAVAYGRGRDGRSVVARCSTPRFQHRGSPIATGRSRTQSWSGTLGDDYCPTVRQRFEKQVQNIGLALQCEQAKTDLTLRAELIRRYPYLQQRFADYDDEAMG
jgi:hypothetical protein